MFTAVQLIFIKSGISKNIHLIALSGCCFKKLIDTLFIGLFLFSCEQSIAQHESDNWYFGEHAGVNFSTGKPVVLYDSQMQIVDNNPTEGVASISDKSGRLLFYTNGVTVWNPHQVMMNGTGLNGNTYSTQSAIIIPWPGKDSLYYIFTTDFFGGTKGLCYSVINMNSNQGLGEVVQKNIPLLSPVCEKITAVKHCNNRDIWVITRRFNSPDYYTYLVSDTGVSLPLISDAGNVTNEDYYKRGYLKVSHGGRKLASIYGSSIEYSDFDKSTGKVSNTQLLYIPSLNLDTSHVNGGIGYGIEFSADDKFMYVSWQYIIIAPITITNFISQFDISRGDIAAIKMSQYNVASSNIYDSDYRFYQAMQLASDGKIYVATMYDLASINNPDVAGINCNFQKHSVDLSPGASGWGLPTFLQSYLFDPVTIKNDCQFQTINFSLGNSLQYDSVRWNFGDAASGQFNFSVSVSPTHIFPTKGTYNVTCLLYSMYSCVDTVTREIVVQPLVDLGNDTAICKNDTLQLKVNIPGALNRWSDGSTDTIFKIFRPGKYWIDVLSGLCKISDTINVAAQPSLVVNLGRDTLLCDNAILLLDAKNPGSSYLWQDNSLNETFTANKAGTYSVKVMKNGCSSADTIQIIHKYKPLFNLGKQTFYCPGLQLTLNPGFTDASYTWQDGSVEPLYAVKHSGLYYATATNDCGIFSDSILVKNGNCHIYVPQAFSPNNDGLNDIFKALEVESVREFNMKIFSRWGDMLFETNDKYKGWDGTNRGTAVPGDSYIYLITYKEQGSNESRLLKGVVTLIR